jgi:hypothetical protein
MGDEFTMNMVKHLPHITPSPRVPAAGIIRGFVSFFDFVNFDYYKGYSINIYAIFSSLLNSSESVALTVDFNLPSITPSPRVPAASGCYGLAA